MNWLTSFNTKLLAVTIAAVGLVAIAVFYVTAPEAPRIAAPGASRPVPGLRLWDTGRPLAGVVFTDESGAEVGLAALKGQVVLMNFWATWCLPCLTEMPSLDRLQAKLGSPGFRVVAVSGDSEGPDIVAPFIAENGLEALPILYDPGLRAARELGVRNLPTTILIGANGAELGRAEGPLEWDSPQMVALLGGIVGGAVQPAAGESYNPPSP